MCLTASNWYRFNFAVQDNNNLNEMGMSTVQLQGKNKLDLLLPKNVERRQHCVVLLMQLGTLFLHFIYFPESLQ